jgi:hypothetical protein
MCYAAVVWKCLFIIGRLNTNVTLGSEMLQVRLSESLFWGNKITCNVVMHCMFLKFHK